MPLQPGQKIAVRYQADNTLWHERVVLSPIRMSRYLTLSPDRELLDEDLATSDGNPLTAFRMVRADGRVRGVQACNFYTFDRSDSGILDDAEYDEWIEEAQNIMGALDLGESSMQPSLIVMV